MHFFAVLSMYVSFRGKTEYEFHPHTSVVQALSGAGPTALVPTKGITAKTFL